jgi:hypothetical protein
MTIETQSNKYKKWYYQIITNRLKNPIIGEYTETHHIVPRSLGGSDDASNLIELSAREHYICHLLLTSMFPPASVECKKMWKAFALMAWYKNDNQKRNYEVNSKLYEKLKKEFSKAQSIQTSGSLNGSYGKKWYHNIELKKSSKYHPDKVPAGWISGRVMNWDNYTTPAFTPTEKNCLTCCSMFLQKRPTHIYCSNTCASKNRYNSDTRKIIITKNGIVKETKRENLHMYRKYGWKLVDRLY